MRYLSESDIKEIGVNWNKSVAIIEESIVQLKTGDFAQPVKPYLRYKDKKNRIIAMPAYVGGEYGSAGIKWIASFPDNIKKNEKRANAVVVLNEVNTGKPYCIINTGLISGIRTASVSGVLLKKYLQRYTNKAKKFKVGIIGFGPIGQLHLDMCVKLGNNKIDTIYIYEKKEVDLTLVSEDYRDKIVIVNSWESLYDESDIVITCTVSSDRYINKPAKKGTLHLNVSLRDYCAEFMKTVDVMIVDDWTEVCRENTDIEMMHLQHNLSEHDVFNIYDAYENQMMNLENRTVMFNPMGMAIFDIAVSHYYFIESEKQAIGTQLPA